MNGLWKKGIGFLLLGLLVACSPSGSGGQERTMFVGPERVECVGVVPQQCLLVKFERNAEWEFFYDAIAGFDYEPGYEYELLVDQIEVANPPADGSSLRYELVAVVERLPVPMPTEPALGDMLLGTSWELVGYGELGQLVLPASLGTIVFEEGGVVGGTTGCNNYGGGYVEMADGGLSVGPLAVTEMACVETAVMEQEATFLDILGTVERFVYEDGVLTLHAADRVLQFQLVEPEVTMPLTGTNWQLMSFVSGETAVSPLAGIEITARFDGEQVNGLAGCNRYFGSYTLTGEEIAFAPLGSTKMACAEEVMQQEADFLAALSVAQATLIEGDQLTLTYPDGALVFLAVEPELNEVPWEEALTILQSGEVEQLFQSHQLEVVLWLKDGRRLMTIEPSIDAIFTAVEECGKPCADIVLATE